MRIRNAKRVPPPGGTRFALIESEGCEAGWACSPENSALERFGVENLDVDHAARGGLER